MGIIKKIKSYNKNSLAEYKNLTSRILSNEKIKCLDNYRQHYKCTRLKHSIDVSYYSFYISKLLRLDYVSAAKAGLMHDLYFREETGLKNRFKMLGSHPAEALENSLEICDLNPIERDIILSHMWLVTVKPPKYKESYIVSFVDKYCAAKEFLASVFSKNFTGKSDARMLRFYL
ncbi:MAG: HD domain-containing protein [Oscillospiraceae bacterium]|nr:HD domain-containing protein [Oscillospiraceae bacterium]